MNFRSFFSTSFFLLAAFLPSISTQAASPVVCDRCSESEMMQQAIQASGQVDAVVVVDRPRGRYFRYVVARTIQPERAEITLRREPLRGEEVQAMEAALRVYRDLTRLKRVDVAALSLPPVARPYTHSALDFVGRPIARRALNHAVSAHLSQQVLPDKPTPAFVLALGGLLQAGMAPLRVDFPDGSSWSFGFEQLEVYWEAPEARLAYGLKPESGRDALGNPIPFSAAALKNFSIQGEEILLQGYRALILRLGGAFSGDAPQGGCSASGIHCDHSQCALVQDCS